jgi:hypothetical protein
MRRAAQMLVSAFYRTKSVAEDKNIQELLNSDRVKSLFEKFQNNIKEEMQKARKELEGKPKN